MRELDFLSTYPHNPQREKKKQKKRKDYCYSFNQLNPEGTTHLLLKGDILTSYEQTNGELGHVVDYINQIG